MKEFMKRIHGYLFFDGLIEMGSISSEFVNTHDRQQKFIPGWGADSTRQKLISSYWFTRVVGHFMVVLAISFVGTELITRQFNRYTIMGVFIAGLISFLILLFFQYLPNFTSDFLPKLNAIKSTFEARQQLEIIKQLREQLSTQQEQILEQQQLFQTRLKEQSARQQQEFQVELQQALGDQEVRILKQQERTQRRFQDQVSGQKTFLEQQQEEIKKCRQAQLSNFALTLIYYAWAKAAGINRVEGNDQTAILLQKLFGVDRGSLRINLELIAGTGSKRKNLGERKLTEMRNRFEEAIGFLKEIDHPKGISVLKELESKILGS